MSVWYADDQVTLHHGDATTVLADLAAASVDCCVTSPPYYGLRDYGVDGQLGAEDTPGAYVDAMVDVFTEVGRVLAPDGTLWLNLGDSYVGGGGVSPGSPSYATSKAATSKGLVSGGIPARAAGVPAKNVLGIPWRVAFALQASGWVLRNAIIWAKPNPMPESVTDRLSTTYETVFLLTRGPRYWFDLDALRVPHRYPPGQGPSSGGYSTGSGRNDAGTHASGGFVSRQDAGRNPGDVWTIPTAPFPGAHFATMPRTLADRCIRAGCKPGGTVLDPFNGSGTTGLAATRLGRRYVGIDLSAEYLDLTLTTRLAQATLDWDAEPEPVAPPPPATRPVVDAPGLDLWGT